MHKIRRTKFSLIGFKNIPAAKVKTYCREAVGCNGKA